MAANKFSPQTLMRIAQAFEAGAVTRKEVQNVTGLSRPCIGAACMHLVECGCIEETGRIGCVFNGKIVERISYRFVRLPDSGDGAEKPDGPCLLAQHWRGVEVRA